MATAADGRESWDRHYNDCVISLEAHSIAISVHISVLTVVVNLKKTKAPVLVKVNGHQLSIQIILLACRPQACIYSIYYRFFRTSI